MTKYLNYEIFLSSSKITKSLSEQHFEQLAQDEQTSRSTIQRTATDSLTQESTQDSTIFELQNQKALSEPWITGIKPALF